jgi:hypothetical protein
VVDTLERLDAVSELTAVRLLREIRESGCDAGYLH